MLDSKHYMMWPVLMHHCINIGGVGELHEFRQGMH